MRFSAQIEKADGGVREVEFESEYDARAVLADYVERTFLQTGEKLVLRPSHGEYVPAIARIDRTEVEA